MKSQPRKELNEETYTAEGRLNIKEIKKKKHQAILSTQTERNFYEALFQANHQ